MPMSVCSAIPVQRSMHFAALQNILHCTSKDTSTRSTQYFSWSTALHLKYNVLDMHCSDLDIFYVILRVHWEHFGKHLKIFLPCPSILFKWYPLCTAGLSSAHEVLTADTLQIYCSDTADGHGWEWDSMEIFSSASFWRSIMPTAPL